MSILPSRSARKDLGRDNQVPDQSRHFGFEDSQEFTWFRRTLEIHDLLVERDQREGMFLFSLQLRGPGPELPVLSDNPDKRLLLLSFRGESKELALLSGLISRQVLVEEELFKGSLKVQDLERELTQLRVETKALRHENQVLKRSLMDISREPRIA